MELRGENFNMVKYCVSCGKANKNRNKFCNYCGVDLKDVKPREASNTVKHCTSCGKAIKMSNQFCNYCGVNLEEAEPNKIQIVDTFAKTRKSVIWVSFIVGIILSLIVIALAITWGDGINVGVLIAISIIIWIPVLLCILMYAIKYRGARKPRIFTLSDKIIRINIPKKRIFQIGWDEFDTLQIKKRTIGYKYIRKFFDLIFTGEGADRIVELERFKDFPDKTCKRIRDLLGEYAIRLNKEYFYGKKKKKKVEALA